jgi:hypothetical protein
MRTDPLTDHAAQVLARMKIRKEEDRRESVVMRASVAPVSRADDRRMFYPPFAIVRDYQRS